MLRSLRRDFDLVMLALVGCALIAAIFYIGGCASGAGFQGNGTPSAGPHPTGTDPIGTLGLQLGWFSWICCLVGVAGVIASFVPTIGAFIPRRAALISFGVGIALAFVRAWVESLGKHIVWISAAFTVLVIAGGIAAAWPWLHGLWNYWRGRKCIGCPAGGDAAPLAPAQEDGA